MKDFDALKNIWHGQVVPPKLSYEDILSAAKTANSSFARKLLFESIGMAGVILVFLAIWAYNPFVMWTSHLSLLIFIGCCFYYILVQYSDYKRISNSEHLLQSPQQFIEYLKAYKRERYILNTRKYSIYSLFIGIAFALYFVEVYLFSPLWQTMAGILFTLFWFIACAYFMRIYIRREQERLQGMIENLERISRQFGE